jgi:putative ABC transport system permease protein
MGIQPTISLKGFDDDKDLMELEGEVRGLLRAKRGLKPIEEDNFALNRPEMIAKQVGAIFGVISFAGAIIGSFAILVGVFGIANIMFVSVKERTNIIGIQKSLGAKNYFILFQFLFEAVFLSLIGGGIGIVLVFLITIIPQDSLELQMSFQNVATGFVVSALAGLISGIVPAWSASKLDPVQAIRAK